LYQQVSTRTFIMQAIDRPLKKASVLLWLLLIFVNLPGITRALAMIPSTPQEQTNRAINSLSNAIAKADGRRLYVDYLIPLPPETSDEDIDPWPGGLAQQYSYAETILEEILQGVVEGGPAGPCQSQVLSAPDCCGFSLQESKAGASKDVAALLFPGPDQLQQIADIDKMVGPSRTLLIFNRQFQRPADFGFKGKQTAKSLIFDRFEWGFAFQELACRGEDVKLTFEDPNWNSCVILEDGKEELQIFDPQLIRPTYQELESKINKVLPQPLWMRKMGEAEEKGFKFQRGNNNDDDKS